MDPVLGFAQTLLAEYDPKLNRLTEDFYQAGINWAYTTLIAGLTRGENPWDIAEKIKAELKEAA